MSQEPQALFGKFEGLKYTPVIGNAYSDHDLMHELYELAVDAAEANLPTLSYDAYDYIGTHVMGVSPMDWAEFVDCHTMWHREVFNG